LPINIETDQVAEHNNFQPLPKTPNPALKSLQRLIGKWRMTGPEVEGQISYEWMEGGFFLIQHFDLVNSGTRAKGVEYACFDEDTKTIRSRLMGTDGARFTYTYEMDGDTLFYWFGDKGSSWFSQGKFDPDGNRVSGRWHMPQHEGGAQGYDYTLIRID
jgi:hypothetical protein